MNSKEQFKKELIELCEKHKMIAVPTHECEPSAHDSMMIIPLDDFWKKYLDERLYL
jgi:hypothetical protein